MMTFPASLASGQGVIPFLLVGVPAGVIGLICLLVAGILALKKKPNEKRSIWILLGVGVLLIAFLCIPPCLIVPFIGCSIGSAVINKSDPLCPIP